MKEFEGENEKEEGNLQCMRSWNWWSVLNWSIKWTDMTIHEQVWNR